MAFIAHSYGVLWLLRDKKEFTPRVAYLLVMSAMYGAITYSYMGLIFGDRTYADHVEFISYIGAPIMLHTVVLLFAALRRGGFSE